MIDNSDYALLSHIESSGIGRYCSISVLFTEMEGLTTAAVRLNKKQAIANQLIRLRDDGLLTFTGDFTNNEAWVQGTPPIAAAISSVGIDRLHSEQMRRSTISTNTQVLQVSTLQAKLLRQQTVLLYITGFFALVTTIVTAVNYYDDTSKRILQKQVEQSERRTRELQLQLERIWPQSAANSST